MSRYPREARMATTKCIHCNAPIVRTISEEFVCVECGDSPLQVRD